VIAYYPLSVMPPLTKDKTMAMKTVKINNFSDAFFSDVERIKASMTYEHTCPECGRKEEEFLSENTSGIHICDEGHLSGFKAYADGTVEIMQFVDFRGK